MTKLYKLKYYILGILTVIGFTSYVAYAATWYLPPTIYKGDLIVATSTTQAVRLPTSTVGSVLSMKNNVPTWVATSTLGISGGSGTPATPLNSIQFNSASAFGGSANLLFTGGNAVYLNGTLNATTSKVAMSSSTNQTVTTDLWLLNTKNTFLATDINGKVIATTTPSGGGSGNSAWTIGNGLIYNATTTDFVGIGTASPSGPLEIDPVSNGTNFNEVIQIYPTITDNTANVNTRYYGIDLEPTINGTSSISALYGMFFVPTINARITNVYSIYAQQNYGVATTTNNYTIYAANPGIGGSSIITNNYGLYLESQVAGTNNYSIYSAGGQSYFAGNIGIGSTTPNALLTVKGTAGSTSDLINITSSTNATLFKVASNGSTTISSLATANCDVLATATGSLYCGVNGTGSGGGTISTSTTATPGKAAIWTGLATLGNGSLLDNGTVAGANATSSTINFNIQGTTTLDPFNVASSTGQSILRVLATSRVGINTTTPGAALHVTTSTTSLPTLVAQATTSQTSAVFDTWSSAGVSMFNVQASGLVGIGSTTPSALLSIQGTAGSTTDLFRVASSTGSLLFSVTSSSTAPTMLVTGASTSNTILSLASSTGTSLMTFDSKGHLGFGGTAPTLTSCNTGTVLANSTDVSGAIIPGAAQTTCTITFATARTNTPFCVVTQAVGSAVTGLEGSSTPTTLVITGTTIGGDTITYYCPGN